MLFTLTEGKKELISHTQKLAEDYTTENFRNF